MCLVSLGLGGYEVERYVEQFINQKRPLEYKNEAVDIVRWATSRAGEAAIPYGYIAQQKRKKAAATIRRLWT
jgi:hypothetical protein